MIAFLFPGQGSQQRGMGQELFEEVREYAALEPEIDSRVGCSLRKLCLEDPDKRLGQTQYTQPCLYTVNALHYQQAINKGMRPTYLAGHSLGEYNALLAAGAFDFVTGLRAVCKRGELMAQARNGAMAAVVGLRAAVVSRILQDNVLTSLDVANFNAPLQIVISGPSDDILRAGPVFEAAGAKMYVPLPVSAAFHSRYLAQAAETFAEFLAPLKFASPKIPVLANVTAEPYPTQGASQEIKRLLVKQITHPVQWTRSVRHLLALGTNEFKEIGPGNVLTRLVQQIQQEADA